MWLEIQLRPKLLIKKKNKIMNVYLVIGDNKELGENFLMYTNAKTASEAVTKFINLDYEGKGKLDGVSVLDDITKLYVKDVEEVSSIFTIETPDNRYIFSASTEEEKLAMLKDHPHAVHMSMYTEKALIVK